MASLKEKMESELTEKIGDAFESVIQQKSDFYQKNPSKIPAPNTIDSMIGSSALANSAISGGASLVPGPWGMLAVIPELVLVIRNQIGLIYDIAAAHGKKDIMTKELAASIFAYSMGNATGGILVVHGSKVLVKRASLQVFQKIVAMLGGKITQQALKSAISKWLPGVGAAAMAAWTNYSTRQIGKKARELLTSDFTVEERVIDVEPVELLAQESPHTQDTKKPESKSIDFYKTVCLISLSNIDGIFSSEEQDFIGEIIDKLDVSSEEKMELIELLSAEKVKPLGLDVIKESLDDAIMLLSDLTALAKADGKFHISEKLFIKQIGKALGFSEADIEEVMSQQ